MLLLLIRRLLILLLGHLGGGAIHQFDATPLWAVVLHLAVEYLECQIRGGSTSPLIFVAFTWSALELELGLESVSWADGTNSTSQVRFTDL